jgi:hypothetical protein
MPLPCRHLRPGLDHFPLRRVNHEGSFRDFRLAAQQLKKARHGRHTVDHAFVHADVDDVGAVLHLLTRDGDSFFVLAFLDQFGELRRPGHIGALTNHDVDARLLGKGL